ncbi:uncharacterized protein TNIN_288861 [Trichonephila inaurata madagascariensis]|uniref:Uncharacterized protein n=1 Tax=Trichonephila inaurata madagascariensis TaxID=2747483 RepID=A0A8X6WUF3_9ARAC|nr:uncharacterized protein TNIN_288861 [Trichonephila inaurata madagascariensis]
MLRSAPPSILQDKPNGPLARINIEEQGVTNCYSMNDRVDSPLDVTYKTKELCAYFEIQDTLEFDPEENELFYPDSKPGIMFAVHSPFDAVNPFEEGIFMKPGNLYRISVQMDEEELLPYPYKTNCLNYTEMWLSANKTGSRTQEEVEAFSYIGGFIGIWLGVSLVQVVDVCESVFLITRYFFKKGTSGCSKQSKDVSEDESV